MREQLDEEVARIEEGEAWDDTDEVEEIAAQRPLDKVIPVRVSSETWAMLRKEAKVLGVGPTTLVRMWLMERLREKPGVRRAAG